MRNESGDEEGDEGVPGGEFPDIRVLGLQGIAGTVDEGWEGFVRLSDA